MTSRVVTTDWDKDALIKFIGAQPLPFTVSITKGKRRSVEQNKLQRMWMNEISEQLGDQTPEEVRGYCKAYFGVPILLAENEEFAEKYMRIIKPLPYETRLEIMQMPLDFPVTRLMTVKQKSAYLDAVYQHFSGQGLILTQPEAA